MLMICSFNFILLSCNKESDNNRYGGGQTTEETPGETPGAIPDDSSKIVLAYVTSWSSIMPDPNYVTHINYAFGHVNATFNGVTIDNKDRLKSIVELKKTKPSLKVLLSIGGWQSGGFSEMAMTDANRKSFATDCKLVVDDFNLDGIDIDWEYPTSNAAGISASSKDKDNFNFLMQAIRASIGNDKWLTFASASTTIDYYDLKTLAATVNFVNIMMYDVDVPPYHQSALHRSDMVNAIAADESIDKHIEGGMPAKKLVLGIPFYGHGAKGLPYSVNYSDIIKLQGYIEKWDSIADVPYLENAAGEVVLVYDNAQSIGFKCEYLLQQGLRGAMYWEYSQDDSEGTLRKAVWNGIMK